MRLATDQGSDLADLYFLVISDMIVKNEAESIMSLMFWRSVSAIAWMNALHARSLR